MTMKILFLHGWNSVPGGVKPTYLATHGHTVLISVAPAGLEQMFFEVGVPLAEGATTAPPPTKDEIERLLAVAPGYGIEIRLPH
jgi:hypothetical protein